MVLGYTQEQRASELQAGLRAELIPSPVTRALSSLAGRTVARVFLTLISNEPIVNYVMFRTRAIVEVMQRHIPPGGSRPVLLDPVGGYGMIGVMLAELLPHAEIIEMDRPEVMRDKRRRLEQARDVVIPPNLKLIEASLRETPLLAALGGKPVDVLMLNGAYVTHENFTTALRSIHQSLRPGGACVVAFPMAEGVRDLRREALIFRAQVGSYPGLIEDQMQVHKILEDAGYQQIKLYRLSELAAELGYPEPANVEILGVGHRPPE